MENKRWYDKHKETKRALNMLRTLPPELRKIGRISQKHLTAPLKNATIRVLCLNEAVRVFFGCKAEKTPIYRGKYPLQGVAGDFLDIDTTIRFC